MIRVEKYILSLILGAKFNRHGAVTMPLFRRAKIISNFDLIIDWTDKLLDKWRAQSKDHIHTDIVEDAQSLLLQIFGFIAFDFDLGAFVDHTHTKGTNELNKALDDMISIMNIVFFSPRFFSKIYLTLNLRYRRARATVEQYLDRMIEQELGESEESRTQRKRTSLIASLVASLQQDEKLEASKCEEDKRGKDDMLVVNCISFLFLNRSFSR
jgi:cytochrome P450